MRKYNDMKSVFSERCKRRMSHVDIGENVEHSLVKDMNGVEYYTIEIRSVVVQRTTSRSAQTKRPRFFNT